MSDVICIDIETRRTEDPAVIRRLQASVKPPGQYKKADSIAQWHATEGAAARVEAVSRTALDGTYGSLASVAWVVNDDAPQEVHGDDEAGMLHAVREILSGCANIPGSPTLVAFNGEFDFRFLKKRFIINRIPAPYLPLNRWDSYFDPMKEWEGYRGYISQADLEAALGIVRDDDMTGAGIGDAIDTGDWASVVKHNLEDVRCLREIYKRMTL